MEHAVTLGDVLIVSGTVFGFFAVCGLVFLIISIMNPFRSGH